MEHSGMAAELPPSVQLDGGESNERVDNCDHGSSNKKATAVVLKKRLLDEEEKTDGRGRLKKFRSIVYIYKITRPVTAKSETEVDENNQPRSNSSFWIATSSVERSTGPSAMSSK